MGFVNLEPRADAGIAEMAINVRPSERPLDALLTALPGYRP